MLGPVRRSWEPGAELLQPLGALSTPGEGSARVWDAHGAAEGLCSGLPCARHHPRTLPSNLRSETVGEEGLLPPFHRGGSSGRKRQSHVCKDAQVGRS